MAKLFLVLSLLFRTAFAAVIQSDFLKTFSYGDTVVLECFISVEDPGTFYQWYKLTVGQAPVHMVSYSYGVTTFYGEFKNNSRYKTRMTETRAFLSISEAMMSDVGMYYCGYSFYGEMTFGHGVFLMHEGTGSRTQHLIQQPVSESVQPGDSVTLNCTIHTETCAGEHSVYWFRHGSGESHPGIIYIHGDRSGQCEKSPEAGSPTQSCVYNLPKTNLSLSDAGTYYCAVALCGEILFGDGTNLDFGDVYQISIMVSLSVMRTGVILCCLAILTLFYVTRK